MLMIATYGIILRLFVGYFPYSGEQDLPKFGDYEAQRHWMEVTVNYPMQQWYTASPEWWPLDYPPLTAYHEYIMGRLSSWYDPASIGLNSSWGYETDSHRSFMRLSVIISDVVSYFLAAFLVVRNFRSSPMRISVFALLILNPAVIFVDHSHFQYNSVACGLVVLAVWLIQSDRVYSAAVAYTLSFMFKQTLLYFAPIFFSFMVGQAFQLQTRVSIVLRISGLGLCVIGTVAAVLSPLLLTCDSAACFKQTVVAMFTRIFPFHRGLFEDYVANAWVVFNPILRLRGATASYLRFIRYLSSLITLSLSAVPGWALLRRPEKSLLPVGLATGSLSFYLSSIMVHEKAIVLPVIFVLLSVPTLWELDETRVLPLRVIEAAFLSLTPLMKIEEATLGGFSVFALGWLVSRSLGPKTQPRKHFVSLINIIQTLSNVAATIAVSILLTCNRPIKYPFIYELIISSCCFVTFVLTWFVLNRRLVSSVNTVLNNK
jgi:alpha-1,3-glucosyltransferase